MSQAGLVNATPIKYSKKAIEEIAAYFSQKMGFIPGGDIEELVERLGGTIEYQDYNDWIKTQDGSILVYGPRHFKIYVSSFTGPLRNRFTIAHEIGHYVLHSEFGKKKIRAARSGSTPVEWEANFFAAELLMPRKEFLRLQAQNRDDFYIASHFLVSTDAVSVRKKSIG